jgi:hypothetical protein
MASCLDRKRQTIDRQIKGVDPQRSMDPEEPQICSLFQAQGYDKPGDEEEGDHAGLA